MNQNSKNTLAIVIILAVTVIAVALILTKADSPSDLPVTTPQTNQETNLNGVETVDEFREAFIETCAIDAPYNYCVCAYEYMEDEVGKKGIVEEAVMYDRTNEVSPLMEEAAYNCIEHL